LVWLSRWGQESCLSAAGFDLIFLDNECERPPLAAFFVYAKESGILAWAIRLLVGLKAEIKRFE